MEKNTIFKVYIYKIYNEELTDKDVKSTLHLTGELDDKDVKSTLNLIGEKCSLTESSTKLNLNVIEKVFIAVLESQNFIL